MSAHGLELLEAAAQGRAISLEQWPGALEALFAQLESTIRNEFRVPRIPPPDPPPPPLFGEALSRPEDGPASQSSTSTAANKENAPPSRPPIPPFSALQATPDATQSDTEMNDATPQIPQSLLDLHGSICEQLNKSFSKFPPHTIQRLAELVLYPTQHYRFLPSYLRALDRVVCVSSSADIFPLPQAAMPVSRGSLTNGTGEPDLPPLPAVNSLGSDESLGGALLTPIPWLRPERIVEDGISPTQAQALNQLHGQPSQGQNELKSEETEMVDGPNGVGRIETVSVVNGVLSSISSGGAANGSPSSTSPQSSPTRPQADNSASAPSVEESLREAGAVTQGELIRLEQEAGVVPVSVASRSPQRHRTQPSSGAGDAPMSPPADSETVDDGKGEEDTVDESPHARGPAEISAEDVGPGQQRLGSPGELDMEKAVGRSSQPEEAPERVARDEMKDAEKAESEERRQPARQDVEMKESEGRATADDEDTTATLSESQAVTSALGAGEEKD